MRHLFFLLLFCSNVLAIENGILKLNQNVKPAEIVDDFAGAVTLRYAIDSIVEIIKYSTKSERSSYASTEIENSDHSDSQSTGIWAVDLNGTYMRSSDLSVFLIELNPLFLNLSVLSLKTVSLNQKVWDVIFSYLERDHFKYVDVCGTTFANRGIIDVLNKGNEIYGDSWESLSLKLIFANKSYYKKLKNEMEWYKTFVTNKLLHYDWDIAHKSYFDTEFKVIEKAKPLHILTGDSDYENEWESMYDEYNKYETIIEGLESISLK